MSPVSFPDNLFSLADFNPENKISVLQAKAHIVPLHDVPGPALLPAGPPLLLQVYIIIYLHGLKSQCD